MHVDWALILKFLQGNCSEEEIKQIHLWKDSNQENLKFFDELVEIWQTSGELSSVYEPNKEKAWEVMCKNAGIENYVAKKPKWNYVITISRWAAVFLVLFSIGLLIKTIITPKNVMDDFVALQSGNTKTSYLLPDSTVVTLDKNAHVKYIPNLNGNKREVNLLKGKAYFEVKPDRNRPFIVYTNGCAVEVVGTAFFLGADTIVGMVDLIVVSGKVKFYKLSKPDSVILVTKNEKAVFHISENRILKEVKYNPNEIVWKTGNFIFEEERLDHICDLLSNYYGVKIVMADTSLKALKLTAGYHNQPLINIINAIEAIHDIEADTVNNTIVLSNKFKRVRN